MTTPTRLFARTLARQQHFRQLSRENFVIVLLDVYKDGTCLHHELGRLPNCHYFRASTIDDCKDLITQDEAKNALIMLIVFDESVDFIDHNFFEFLPQLSYIYLFDSVLSNKRFSIDQRFRGVFHDVQSLFKQIDADIKEKRFADYEVGGVQYVLQDTAKFVWYRFFINILDCLQHTDIARREIFPRARQFYVKDVLELSIIDEFERGYNPEDAIRWYTRECFFYRLLNKALRGKDLNEVFIWRAYIQDLHRNLRARYSEQMRETGPHRLQLFRGQFLHKEDVKRHLEGIGQLITMSSFSSTSLELELARYFIDYETLTDSPMQGVIYRIFVDLDRVKTTCVYVSEFSSFRDEKEHLFSLRAMFRIEKVEFVNNLWEIDLTAVDEDNSLFCTAINSWKAIIGEQSFFSGRQEPLFTRYLKWENSLFITFQLLLDIILRLDRTDYARQEMIEMCKQKYADSSIDLEVIDNFDQSYDKEDAVKWYTTESFLYRLLNNSLRLEDINTLFNLRYYIDDLHNQLAQLQTSYIQSLGPEQSVLTLYRGQRMNIEDLNKLRGNIGELISKNSFLSTTNDVQAAVFFSGADSLDNPDKEASVLYQITVDTRESHTIPFAKIQYASIFKDEDEVLFSMAAVFRIDNVEQYGNLWVVDLTLINKEDEEWNQLTDHLNRSINSTGSQIDTTLDDSELPSKNDPIAPTVCCDFAEFSNVPLLLPILQTLNTPVMNTPNPLLTITGGLRNRLATAISNMSTRGATIAIIGLVILAILVLLAILLPILLRPS